MWPLCTANNFLWILLPLLIGLFTGWWIWASQRRTEDRATEPAHAAAAPEPARTAGSARKAPEVFPLHPNHVAAGPGAGGSTARSDVTRSPGPAGVAASAIGIAPAVGDPDDMKRIKGIGPSLDELLRRLGITRFDQIAAWTADDVAKVDEHLGAFRGRIDRDQWIEQAKLLARGATDEFEARFGGTGPADR